MADTATDFTRRLLVDAGVDDGIRVLDVGCGTGDLALLAAALVGEQGEVVGVDREPGPLATAQERARELRLPNVRVTMDDLAALSPDLGLFDAVLGRRVLTYQPDAVRAVRQLARSIRPGGLIVLGVR